MQTQGFELDVYQLESMKGKLHYLFLVNELQEKLRMS